MALSALTTLIRDCESTESRQDLLDPIWSLWTLQAADGGYGDSQGLLASVTTKQAPSQLEVSEDRLLA